MKQKQHKMVDCDPEAAYFRTVESETHRWWRRLLSYMLTPSGRGGVSYADGGATDPPTSDLPHQLFLEIKVLEGQIFSFKCLCELVSYHLKLQELANAGNYRKIHSFVSWRLTISSSLSFCPTNFVRKAPPMRLAVISSASTCYFSGLSLFPPPPPH